MQKIVLKNMEWLQINQGNYSAIWRPYHYIGLELAQSIYSIALDKKPTGCTKFFNAEVVSVAKKIYL